jgi:hypothetical protein
MSLLSREQAARFLAPLRGSFTTLLFHETKTRTLLGRFLLECANQQPGGATILDSSAYYCTHAADLSGTSIPEPVEVLLPTGGFEPTGLLPLLSSSAPILIIDDLNSLYSLASDRRRLHQLTVLVRLLSYNAKMNGRWVVATAYRTELGGKREAKARSTTAMGDLLAEASIHEGRLRLKADFPAWSNGAFDTYFAM